MSLARLPFLAEINSSKVSIPFASAYVVAGFPSPADDYIDDQIDLNEYLIRHPTSTFFLRVQGESMKNAGIRNGDLLIVDRSLNPQPKNIVIAILDGEFTIKRLNFNNGIPSLDAENKQYNSINLNHYEDVQIWGVVTHSIRTF